jgi:sec-independent protein translocase protein TatA
MFGLQMPELLVILVIALIIFGPKKLPELGRGVGKMIREFKKAGKEVEDTLDINTDIEENNHKEKSGS